MIMSPRFYAVRPPRVRLNILGFNISRIASPIAYPTAWRSSVKSQAISARRGATDHSHFAAVFNRIRPARKVGGYYSELEVIVKVSYTVGEESFLAMAGEDLRPAFE
jgi:hypothetical protein